MKSELCTLSMLCANGAEIWDRSPGPWRCEPTEALFTLSLPRAPVGSQTLSSENGAQQRTGELLPPAGAQLFIMPSGTSGKVEDWYDRWACASVPPEQRAWLDAHEDASLDARMRQYLMWLYRIDESVNVSAEWVNVSQLGFFWQRVPGRDTFSVRWRCWQCQHAPRGLIWAPIQDASWSPAFINASSSLRGCESKGQNHSGWYLLLAAEHCSDRYRQELHRLLAFPGFFVVRNAAEPVPDDHWVEVIRIARLSTTDSQYRDADLSAVGQVWFWRAFGSGIWWNVGRSFVVTDDDTEHHGTRGGSRGTGAISCWVARRNGFDSIQLMRSFGGFAYEMLDCRGATLPNSHKPWTDACPPEHVQLLSGTPARRFTPALAPWVPSVEVPCQCNVAEVHHNAAATTLGCV